MKQNIRIFRFDKLTNVRPDPAVHYSAIAEPEDGSWMLFVDYDGRPHLVERIGTATDENGDEHTAYAPHEAPDYLQ